MRLIGEHLLRSRYQLPKLYAAKIIELTIKDELTNGLKTIATDMDNDDEGTPTISCTYTPSCGELGATVPIQEELYIVGYLAM
jgi:hypothetical protein